MLLLWEFENLHPLYVRIMLRLYAVCTCENTVEPLNRGLSRFVPYGEVVLVRNVKCRMFGGSEVPVEMGCTEQSTSRV